MNENVFAASTPPFFPSSSPSSASSSSSFRPQHQQQGDSAGVLSVDVVSSTALLNDDTAAASATPARPHMPKFKVPGFTPPPLNSYALSAQTFSERRILGPTTVDELNPEVHRGVALAALQRLIKPSRTSARATAAAAAAAAAATPSESGHPLDVARVAAIHTSVAASLQSLPSYSRGTAAASHTSTNAVPDDPGLLGATQRPGASAMRLTPSDSVGTERGTPAPRELPWWKRILVDVAYRRRVMQFSTEGYREEMRLLRDTPEVLSSSAAKEVRKVWRERSWWADELEKAELKPSAVLGADASATMEEPVGVAGGGGGTASEPHRRRARETAPIMDEVDEVVVMAQHVTFRLYDDDEVAVHFSTKHPHSVMEASAVERVTRVALGAMPPVHHVREQQRQEQVVTQHLASLRRFSASTSHALKQRLARDVLAGRAEVPMQTAITEAVLDNTGSSSHHDDHHHHHHDGGSRNREKYVFAPRRPVSDVTAAAATNPAVARARAAREKRWQQHTTSELETELITPDTPLSPSEGWHAPLQRRPQPPTPLWQRRQLPPGIWPVDAAKTAATRAEVVLHSSAVRDPIAVLKREAKAAAAAADAAAVEERPQHGASNAATVRSVAHVTAETRRREAAAACVNGTENLYGLQYVWRLPLPPGGFVRVAPDPRYAMWPDSDDDDEAAAADGEDAGAGAAGGGGAGLYGWAAAGSVNGAAVTSQQLHRQARMRRLARRVNTRTQKLRWLHRFGHHRVCYNDLALSDTDSDAAHGDSSSDSADDDDEDNDDSDGFGSGAAGSRGVAPRSGGRRKKKNGLSTDVGRRALIAALPNLLERSRGAAATRGPEVQNQLRRLQRQEAKLRSMARGVRPVCEGALHINIYADVVPRAPQSLPMNSQRSGPGIAAAALAAHQQQQQVSTRRFLGCYRQSRLLIHYKLYCRALYEEERVRCGGSGAHVMGRAGSGDPTYTPATDAALAGVPVIPFPVLRLQARAPTLRKPITHRNPIPSTIGECRCWEGLYPTPSADLAAPVQQAWRKLRESVLVRQALRDLFDGLAHDKEGLLDKRTFVLFVLQLLQLFFPTHLPAAVHIAIAEEEWTYRGTTEHVGAQTFHEKFFVFPFIFHRDIAAVTEEHLVEFWTLVRVCFDAQQQQRQQQRQPAESEAPTLSSPAEASAWRSNSLGSANPSARSSKATGLSILMPLTGFTASQLDTLASKPPPPFDETVYDQFCLLREAFRENPLVRATPREHQYVVARHVVKQQLRLEHRRLAAAAAATATATAAAAADNAALLDAGPTAEQPEMLATDKVQLGSADAARRADIEAAALREWEARQRRLEAQEHDALLEQSGYYIARIGRLQSRAATVLSGIESTCSTWDLHRTDVYAMPHDDDGTDAGRRRREEDVEEQLLEYLEDVPLDVYDGEVSLRERYLLHVGFQEERRHHALPWLQARTSTTHPETAAAPTPTKTSGARPTPPASTARKTPVRRGFNVEDEAQRYLAVMKGTLGATQRRNVLFAQDQALLGNGGDDFTRLDEAAKGTSTTRSFAAGLYPLRAVPRTSSAIISPHKGKARRGGGGGGGETEEAGEGREHPRYDGGKRSRRRSGAHAGTGGGFGGSSTTARASLSVMAASTSTTARLAPGRGSASRLTQRKSLAATYAGHDAGRVSRGGGGGVTGPLRSTTKASGSRGVVANPSFYRKTGLSLAGASASSSAATPPAASGAAVHHTAVQPLSPFPAALSVSVSVPATPTSLQVDRHGNLSTPGSRKASMRVGFRGGADPRLLPGTPSVTSLATTVTSQAALVNVLDSSEASSSVVAGALPSVTWMSQTLTAATSPSSCARGTGVGTGGGGGPGRRPHRPMSPTSTAAAPHAPAQAEASRFSSRLRAQQERQERYRKQFNNPVKLGGGGGKG